jgi:spore germination cell wall hydrolase CwlJ-like protein
MIAIQKSLNRRISSVALAIGLVISTCFVSIQPAEAEPLEESSETDTATEDIVTLSFRGEIVAQPVIAVASPAVQSDQLSETPVSLDVMQDDLDEVNEILDEIARKEAEEAALRAKKAAERKAAEEAAAKAAADAGLSPTRSLSYEVREVNGYTELEYLAAICYIESGNKYEGSLAVANIVLNRLQSSRYPSTIYDVIYQRNQFAVARMDRVLAGGSYSNCLKAAINALAGYNNIGSLLHFNASYTVSDSRKNQLSTYVIIDGNLFFE